MYDYIKALQKRFDHQEHSELDKQVEYAQEELRRDMDAVGRGLPHRSGGYGAGQRAAAVKPADVNICS